MNFLIAATFTDALARLPAPEQKAVKTSAFDLQTNPSAPGLQLHRIDKSKDQNFWSVRVNRDIRIIVHKTAASFLLAYVDHHDRAYAWAERRRIEAHPKTGAVQIVEVRERVEAVTPDLFTPVPTITEAPKPAPPEPPLFHALSADDLLAIGVPQDWVATVRAATESRFFDIVPHLPAEASEALLEYAATGKLARPEPAALVADPFAHPDALRRFRVVENLEELQAALDSPWEKWAVFLHPSQRATLERAYTGPARVAGSAGTGKTVVALHRAARLAQRDVAARILLTTFSQPLAKALQHKLAVLLGHDPALARITVAPWARLADELFQLVFGRRPRVATDDQVRAALTEAAQAAAETVFSERFLFGEFTQVVDAWQVPSVEAYAETPRPGRRSRLGNRQREKLWPVFTGARGRLQERGLTTWPQVFAALTAHYAGGTEKPFDHIVVDEAQDLGVAELRLLAVLAGPASDRLFFAGDLGQRIFQPPFSWKALGVDVRGRSTTLKVNYRTSHQIREAADRLLPAMVRDMDGREEVRRGTISVFDGPTPEILIAASEAEEILHTSRFIKEALAAGIQSEEIGIFVRERAQLDRGRRAIVAAGLLPVDPGDAAMGSPGHVALGTMHLAKGLEFKAVAVMACDNEVLPDAARVASAVDESDLEEIYDTERQLFYVACTRARDRLLASGVAPASEFLADLR